MLKAALLVLTLTADGAVLATLTSADDAEDCSAKQEVIRQVLESAGITPLVNECGQTELTLTPFDHGAGPEAQIHRYRVDLPEAGGFTIAPLSADQSCTAAPDANPAIYCTRSAQQVVTDG